MGTVSFMDERLRRLHAEMLAALRSTRSRPTAWVNLWDGMVARYGEKECVEMYHHAREYLRETRG